MPALHDDLLEVAIDLSLGADRGLRQAILRRAVSTAYYALFHMFIHETTRYWSIAEQRSALGRAFSHGSMKTACANKITEINSTLKSAPPADERMVAEALRTVASAFVSLQDRREAADYDTAATWTQTDVDESIATVIDAFETWKGVRETQQAQDFLLSLLVKKR